MRIGELAARGGITAKTLRFYEEAGVLPTPLRTPGGHRDYGPDSLDRLAFIHAAQAAGLTLAEIRTVITIRDRGTAPCAHVLELLDTKAKAVTRQLTELRLLKSELDRLPAQAAAVDRPPANPAASGRSSSRHRAPERAAEGPGRELDVDHLPASSC